MDGNQGREVIPSPGGGPQGQSARILVLHGTGRPQNSSSVTSTPYSSSSKFSSYSDSPRQGPMSTSHANSDLPFAYDSSGDLSGTSGTASPVVIVRARESSVSSQSMVGSTGVTARDHDAMSSSSSSSRGYSTIIPVSPGKGLDSNSFGSAFGSIDVPTSPADPALGLSPSSRVIINPEDYLSSKCSPHDDSHSSHRLNNTVDTKRACRAAAAARQRPVPPLSFQSSIAALTAAAATATANSPASSGATSSCNSTRSLILESPMSSFRDFSTLSPISSPSSNEPSPLVQSPEHSEMAFIEAGQPVFSVDGPKDKVSSTIFESARKETFYLLSVNFFPVWLTQTQDKMNQSGMGDVPIPRNLATVLVNDYWRESFEKFLKTQLAAENLSFYQETTRYLETEFSSTEMMELDAQKIFLRFIAPDATEQINTSAEICHALCRVLFHKELEVVMEEQRSKQEQRSALLADMNKGSSGQRRSGKFSPIKTSESFGSDKELEQLAASGEDELLTPRHKSALLRSLSHFSLWKKFSDTDNVPKTARPSLSSSSSSSSSLKGGDNDADNSGPGALKNTHSFSTTNLVQYQQQQHPAAANPAWMSKVHRTRSASTGLNNLANEANATPRRSTSTRRHFDLSISDSVSLSSQSSTTTNSGNGSLTSPGQSDMPAPVTHPHGHHHHSSSSLSARRHYGSPLVDSNCGPPPIDVAHCKKHSNGTNGTLSPSSPLSGNRLGSPKQPSPRPPSQQQQQQQQQSQSHSKDSQKSSHSKDSHSRHHSHQKGMSHSSSKNSISGNPDSELSTSQIGLSPPVLPERLPLQDASVVASSPHKKHKNKTTPRATASPIQDPTSENSTPKTSHSKTRKQSSKSKSHSKRSKDEKDGFRRSGSTHSLDDTVSVSIVREDDHTEPSFRLLAEDEDTGTAPSPTTAVTVHSFRKGSSGAGGFRRGSYDSAEVRKPSSSFSSSDALSDVILSIDSCNCTSGELTPKVTVVPHSETVA